MMIRRILRNIGEGIVIDVHPAGKDIIAEINRLAHTVALPANATGSTTLAAYEQLEPEDQVRVNQIATDFITNILGITAPIPGTNVTGTRDYRAGIALMMSITVTGMAVGYMFLVIWVSFMNMSIPDWTDIFIPFLALTAVVWNYNGLLTKENRDALATSLGNVPGGFFATVLQGFLSKGRKTPPPTQ